MNTTKQADYTNEIAMVANFAGVPVDKIVGPMNPQHLPVKGRDGTYIRISPKTGSPRWSKFSGGGFKLFNSNRTKAEACRKPGKKKVRWYGVSEGYALAKALDNNVLSKV